jgi:hypothetical protein
MTRSARSDNKAVCRGPVVVRTVLSFQLAHANVSGDPLPPGRLPRLLTALVCDGAAVRQPCAQPRRGIGLREEPVGVPVDRVVLRVPDDLVELCREVIVRQTATQHVFPWDTHGT